MNIKATPTNWAKECLAILKQIHPDYKKNSLYKGNFIEFTREDENGLILSHNFIKIKDSFNYSFAILFSKEKTVSLYNTFMIGSRFDHNRTIWKQFLDDLGQHRTNETNKPPEGIWSFGPWRSNTLRLLVRGMSVPENFLYKFYKQQLFNGKSRLIDLFEKAFEVFQNIPSNLEVEEAIKLTNIDIESISPFTQAAYTLDAAKVAKGGKLWYGYGPESNTFMYEELPLEAIILSDFECFYKNKDHYSRIIQTLNKIEM